MKPQGSEGGFQGDSYFYFLLLLLVKLLLMAARKQKRLSRRSTASSCTRFTLVADPLVCLTLVGHQCHQPSAGQVFPVRLGSEAHSGARQILRSISFHTRSQHYR